MAVAVTKPRTVEVSVAEAKATLSALLRRVEVTGERINITRRGKVVATLAPPPEKQKGNIVTDLLGLFADHPEVCDEIDKVYAERHLHKARYVEF
jgi:prevent-host-death family protein